MRRHHIFVLDCRDVYLFDDAAEQVHRVDAVAVRGEGEDEGRAQGSVRLDEGRIGEEGAP